MPQTTNIAAYRFLAEVLLYPEDRDVKRLRSYAELAGRAAPELRGAIGSLLADPELQDTDTYLTMFEIGAKCPLYLGHYQFEEPKSCSGAAISGRNSYMIQLKNLYRHFGFELQGGELPDYLPLVLDFLALSAGHPAHKHRQLLVKQFMLPALPALSKALREAGNVYSPIAGMLERLLHSELAGMSAPLPAAEAPTHDRSPGAESRSADLQSAVSPIFNRRGIEGPEDAKEIERPADWKSAIQQVENLRYEPLPQLANAKDNGAADCQTPSNPCPP